jgi:hypothetical protein
VVSHQSSPNSLHTEPESAGALTHGPPDILGDPTSALVSISIVIVGLHHLDCRELTDHSRLPGKTRQLREALLRSSVNQRDCTCKSQARIGEERMVHFSEGFGLKKMSF